jgi:Protein of unknown function (DUF2911)
MKMNTFAKGMLSVLMVACFAAAALAQSNPRGTAILHLRGGRCSGSATNPACAGTVSVEYGRPSLSGRSVDELLGKLPPGGIWRLGADTSTTFKTEIDLVFGAICAHGPASAQWQCPTVTIPAGEYSIWMQRQEGNSWKLLFDKKHGQSGEPAPDASECFASVPLQISGPHDRIPREMVTISLDPTKDQGLGGWIGIQWGTLEARAFFEPE